MAAPIPPALAVAPEAHEARIAACIHCGFCLETCPTFVETGREEESPRGRLLLAMGLATGRWKPEAAVLAPLDACLGCRACEEACPSGVEYGRILEDVRAVTHGHRARPRDAWESFLVRRVLGRRRRLKALAGAYRGMRVWAAAEWLSRRRWMPDRIRRRLRLAPEPESRPAGRPPRTGSGPRALLLRGCAARHLFPETEAAMVRLLDAAGYAVTLAGEPVCCGALAHHLGDRAESLRLGGAVLDACGGDGIVVTTAAGCGAHLKGLDHLFAGRAEAETARRLGNRVRDLTEALADAPRPLVFRGTPETVIYHDACHLKHAQGITEAPRALLRDAGAELCEVPEAELCCGSAGTYNLARDAMGSRLGARKAAVLRRGGAARVVTANPGCAIQLRAHLAREGDPEVTTLARYLASRL
jgi:glycolate oxidase iron-sulfur subunit